MQASTLRSSGTFDERSHKLATLAVDSFGRLGVEGSNFIDQLAASVVGGRDGGSTARKEVAKERLLLIVSVTTQFAIRGGCRASSSTLGTAKKQDGTGRGVTDPYR